MKYQTAQRIRIKENDMRPLNWQAATRSWPMTLREVHGRQSTVLSIIVPVLFYGWPPVEAYDTRHGTPIAELTLVHGEFTIDKQQHTDQHRNMARTIAYMPVYAALEQDTCRITMCAYLRLWHVEDRVPLIDIVNHREPSHAEIRQAVERVGVTAVLSLASPNIWMRNAYSISMKASYLEANTLSDISRTCTKKVW